MADDDDDDGGGCPISTTDGDLPLEPQRPEPQMPPTITATTATASRLDNTTTRLFLM